MNLLPSPPRVNLGRLLNICDYALAALFRKKVKNIAVFVVFAGVIFLFGSFQLVSRGLSEAADELLAGGPDITVQQMSAGRQIAFSLQNTGNLSSIYGIAEIEPRIWGYYFDESNGANYTILGRKRTDIKAEISSANHQGGQDDVAQVVISERVKQLLQLGDRSYFSLFRPDLSQKAFQVVKLYQEQTDIVTADLITMDLADARDLFGMAEGEVTDLLIAVGNPAEIDTVARKIGDQLAGVRVITKKQILKTYKVVFGWRSGFGMICLLTTLMAFIILSWDKASGLSPEEVREIAILKLLGWQTADIITLRFAESLVISGMSFLVGYLLSWIHAAIFDGILFRPILLGWSVLQPTFSLRPSFVVSDLVIILAISVVPFLCATAVPGWRSAVIRADSVV